MLVILTFPIFGGDMLIYKLKLRHAFLLVVTAFFIAIFLSSCMGVLVPGDLTTDDSVVVELYHSPVAAQPIIPYAPVFEAESEPEPEAVPYNQTNEEIEQSYNVEPDVANQVSGYINTNELEESVISIEHVEYAYNSYINAEAQGTASTDSNYVTEQHHFNPDMLNHASFDCGDPACDNCEAHIIPPHIETISEFKSIHGRRPRIALTFDDGPGGLTIPILRIFEEHNARATFCVIGSRVERWPEIVRRTHNGGHEVIGHSWNHANLTQLSSERIEMQITQTSAAIEAATGIAPPLIFRAPYGAVNSRVRAVAEELGYALLCWSIDTNDWRYRDVEHIYNHIMERAVDGAIILLHDIHETTYQAMHLVVPALIERGFDLVTAGEIITQVYGTMIPGVEHRGRR